MVAARTQAAGPNFEARARGSLGERARARAPDPTPVASGPLPCPALPAPAAPGIAAEALRRSSRAPSQWSTTSRVLKSPSRLPRHALAASPTAAKGARGAAGEAEPAMARVLRPLSSGLQTT